MLLIQVNIPINIFRSNILAKISFLFVKMTNYQINSIPATRHFAIHTKNIPTIEKTAGIIFYNSKSSFI